MSNELEFLEGQPSGQEDRVEAAPEPVEAAPAEPVVKTPERGADGKFVAKATEAQPAAQAAPEAATAPEAPVQPAEPGRVPLPVYLGEREKRQAAEKRAQEADARWAEVQRANQPAPSPESSLQAELYAQRMDMSRMFAESRYGAEDVAALHEWAKAKCDADPMFNEQMRSSRNPYEEAMQARNRETIAAKVTPDRLAAFEAWEAAQAAAASGQAPNAPQPPAAAPPPRSLAHAPNAGGQVAAAPENAYEALPFN